MFHANKICLNVNWIQIHSGKLNTEAALLCFPVVRCKEGELPPDGTLSPFTNIHIHTMETC